MATKKMKSLRGACKRFKLTAKGKVKIRRANRNHILGKENHKVKRQRRSLSVLGNESAKMVKKMILKVRG